MLTKLSKKLVYLALVGTMWMAGHGGCDVGGVYDVLGGLYPMGGYGGGYYGGGVPSYGSGYYVDESYYYEEETWSPFGGLWY